MQATWVRSDVRTHGVPPGLVRRFARAADHVLGAAWQGAEAGDMRRARLALGIVGTILAIELAFVAWLLADGMLGNAGIVLALAATTALLPVLLRRPGAMGIVAHVLAAQLTVALGLMVLRAAGATTPPLVVIPFIPMISSLIGGVRVGALWGGVGILQLAVLYWLVLRGLEPSIELAPDFLLRGRFVGSAVMLVFAVLVAAVYEFVRGRALEEASHARHLAEERAIELERQALELERSRQRELELKDRFLSHVSHELRTPLAATHQFLSLVLDEIAGPIGAEQREYLGIAARNVGQLKRMIGDLMELTRARSGKLRVTPRSLDLGEILRCLSDGIRPDAAAADLALELELDPDLPRVLADDGRVRQVVGNLAENAIKFTPPGGRVAIRALHDPAEPERWVRVSVRDTGCGLDAASADRIFDRLHQEQIAESRSRQGLGLGLAICRELVLRQGGRIWVESELGQGAAFHFTLPIFRLADLVAPAISDEGRLVEEFVLVRVALDADGAPADERLFRRVRHELATLVYHPHLDVVLPPLPGDPGEPIVIVARTGRPGLEPIVGRMRRQLGHLEELRSARVRVRVEARAERTTPEERSMPLAEALEHLAHRMVRFTRSQWKETSRGEKEDPDRR